MNDRRSASACRTVRSTTATVLVALAWLAPAGRAAPPWQTFDPLVPPQGLGAVAVDVRAFSSRLSFDADGVPAPEGRLRDLAVEAQAQLGVGERLALTVTAPWTRRALVDPDAGDVADGPGKPRVGLRLVALRLGGGAGAVASTAVDDVQLIVTGEAGVPVSPSVAPVRTPWAAQARPLALRAGDEQAEVTVGGELAARLPVRGAFCWRTGYRLRAGASDAVVGGGAVSVDVLDGRASAAGLIDFTWSLDPAVDRRGEPVDPVGPGLALVGVAARVRAPELDPALALDVGAGISSRGRSATSGVHLAATVSYAF